MVLDHVDWECEWKLTVCCTREDVYTNYRGYLGAEIYAAEYTLKSRYPDEHFLSVLVLMYKESMSPRNHSPASIHLHGLSVKLSVADLTSYTSLYKPDYGSGGLSFIFLYCIHTHVNALD